MSADPANVVVLRWKTLRCCKRRRSASGQNRSCSDRPEDFRL